MNEASPSRQSKFARYRARKKAQGLREIRMWVPDARAPGFKEEAERQAKLLRGTKGEREILRELDALIDETWKDLD